MVNRKLAAALVAAALGLTAAVARAETVRSETVSITELTQPQLRGLALRAITGNDPALALTLAARMLELNPDDRDALMIVALAAPAAGDAPRGMRAGARAFHLSKDRGQRFEAARLTARAAYQAHAYTRAQIWLRRAAFHARGPGQKQLTAYDYRTVRAKNPLRVNLQFSISNSDNVNDGASSRFNDVDGVPVVGILSPSAQALAGTVGWARAQLSYTLSESDRQRSQIFANLFVRQVWLSGEAQAAAPDVDNGDFAAQSLELGADRRWLIGDGRVELSVSGAVGRQYYGGEKSSDYLRLGFGAQRRLRNDALMDFDASIEGRKLGQTGDIRETETRIGFGAIGKLGPGQVVLRLSGSVIDSEQINNASYGADLQLRYRLAKPVGPMRLSVGVGAGYTRYPDYTLLIFPVPGGREDRSLFGSIEISPDGYGVAGFVPVLALTGSRTQSNVGRFDREQLSLQLGFRSTF